MVTKSSRGTGEKVTHPHTPRRREAAGTVKEELVQALVDAVDRTFAVGAHRGEALQWTATLFRQLDEGALRALAYRQGVFEEPVREAEGMIRQPADVEE